MALPTRMQPMQFHSDFDKRNSGFGFGRLLQSDFFRRLRRAPSTVRWGLGILLGFIILSVLWRRDPSRLPLGGSASSTPWHTPGNASDPVWASRAEEVKRAFIEAYEAYETHAFPHDELLPLTNGSIDNFGGWGVSAIDGLDTMIIMGLNDTVARVIQHIESATFNSYSVSFFETTIRYLGSLLSSYALTGNPILLKKADELGYKLSFAFKSESGLPSPQVATPKDIDPPIFSGGVSLLSEAATCQMEYRYLGHATGKKEYVQAADRISNILIREQLPNGMLPSMFSRDKGAAQEKSKFGVGANTDSAYEYLLKQWLLSNKKEKRFLDLYISTTNAVIENLMYISPKRQLLYVTDTNGDYVSHVQEHLACFYSGLLALGVATIPAKDLPPTHAWAAEGLANTCYLSYVETLTGLGPERIAFPRQKSRLWTKAVREWQRNGKKGGVPPGVNLPPIVAKNGHQEDREFTVSDAYSPLRPETIESFFILWRTTKDSKWRDRGWEIFQAIQTHGKAPHGRAYVSTTNVDIIPTPQRNEMPSWFLAETLKYLYLLFSPDDLIPLDKWVLNTEAHPLPVFEWSPEEKSTFGLRY